MNNIKEFHRKIELLFQKVFEKKLTFEDLNIEEVGFNYFANIKGIEKVF